MKKIVITGGKKLHGKIRISGAKNAAVAIIPAVILSDGVCRIENIPNIMDVNLMANILHQMGATVNRVNRRCPPVRNTYSSTRSLTDSTRWYAICSKGS